MIASLEITEGDGEASALLKFHLSDWEFTSPKNGKTNLSFLRGLFEEEEFHAIAVVCATSAEEEVTAYERVGVFFPGAGGLELLYDGEDSVLACENFAFYKALDVMSLPFVPAQARNGAHWSLGEQRNFPSTASTLSCQLRLDPNDHKLTSVGLLLDVSQPLTLFEAPEPIVMRNPGAVVNIDLSGASPTTRVTLKGALDFGGLRLFADCTLPQGEFGADLIEMPPTPPGEAGGPAATRLSESAFSAFQGLPDLDVVSASVTGDARAGTWSAQLNMSGTWKLLDGVGVRDPRFTITREEAHPTEEDAAGKGGAETPPESAPSDEGRKQIRATAQGTALLGALRVDTTLEHSRDNWHLRGKLLRPNASAVQDWARAGHGTDLGHVLGDVELTELHLEASTEKGEFSVRCSGRWSVLPQGSTCELDITRGAAERADLTVVLPVVIDGTPHPMTWRGDASRGSGERIDLSWKDESGVNLGAVVRALHPGADLPDELLPVVTELSLGYTKHPGTQSPGGSTLTLAVLSDPVSVAVALDHPAANGSQTPGTALALLTRASLGSSLTASHLPMVGQLIPSDLDAGVSRADLTLTRPRLDAETVRRINTALPETLTLPEPSEGRTPATCLSLTLTLPGQSDSRVDLNLGGGSDAEADTGPRSIPAADAPEVKGTGTGTSDDSPVQKSSSGATSSDEGEGTASGGDSEPSVSWKDVRRQLGPLDLRKIGLGHHDRKLWLMFDAGLAFAGLSAQTDGLGLGFSPAELRAGQFTPEPMLDGLTVAYSRPPLTLSGGFERWPADDEFDVRLGGTVNVSATKFSLEAVGSYQHARAGWFSLDVIGRLGIKFGEPPVFVVTGLMGGFGYNSRLRVPAITEVDSFPLLTAMTDTAPENTKDGAEGTKDDTGGTEGTAGAKAEVSESGTEETKPAEASTEGEGQAPKGGTDPASAVTERQTALLEQLRGEGDDAWLVPAAGEFWAAAGLTFTAFEMISGEAVLAVGLGDDLSITLIGHANATFPSAKDVPGAAPATLYAVADMDLRVGYLRSQHLFSAEARLTDKTYVVSKDCRVTGGLALYTWMSGPHGGDFVLSIGGYPDGYPVPDHYPKVDRVAIDWTPATGVVVHGDAYFALTPRAIMAGGALNVSYRSGGLHAWLDLAAHILIAWAPFHFDVGVSVSIGVEYTFSVFGWDITLGAHFSVDVDLYGPPTGGRVTIDWTVISFHVNFGAPPQGALAQRLSWEEFSQKLLPEQHLLLTPLAGLGTEAHGTDTQPHRSDSVWTVAAHGFSFSMRCAVPAARVGFCNRDVPVAGAAPSPVCVRPMGVQTTGGYHSVRIEASRDGQWQNLTAEEVECWTTTVATGSVPAALWGAMEETGPGHDLVRDQILGLTCTVADAARIYELDLSASVLSATTEPTAALPFLN